MLDPDLAPADELAALYTQRLVAQGVWAHLLVHYALRVVMHTAAAAPAGGGSSPSVADLTIPTR